MPSKRSPIVPADRRRHRGRRWRAVLAGLLLAGCTPGAVDPLPDVPPRVVASLPYLDARAGVPVVPVEIEGRGTFRFIVDTGATGSAVYARAAPALGAAPREGSTAVVRGITGSRSLPTAELSGLRMGARVYDGLMVAILPSGGFGPDIDGILGMDVLGDHALLFDPETDRLTFIAAGTFDKRTFEDGWARRWDRVPIARRDDIPADYPLYFTTLRFRQGPVPVLIDTGASFSALNWPAARLRQELRTLYRSLREQWVIEGAVGSFSPRSRVIVDQVRFGEHEWEATDFVILDLDALDVLAGADPLIIAGADILLQRRFILDFRGGEMLVDPASGGRRGFVRPETGSRIPNTSGSGSIVRPR